MSQITIPLCLSLSFFESCPPFLSIERVIGFYIIKFRESKGCCRKYGEMGCLLKNIDFFLFVHILSWSFYLEIFIFILASYIFILILMSFIHFTSLIISPILLHIFCFTYYLSNFFSCVRISVLSAFYYYY